MSKIILQLSGGLGNQMFQYALCLHLMALNRDVTIDDVTEYAGREESRDARYVQRQPMLESAFGITYKRASEEDRIALTDSDMHLASRIRRKLTGRKSKIVQEPELTFDPEFLTKDEGYFVGCFQSEKYFSEVSDRVRKAYTFKEERIQENSATVKAAEKIREASSSCAVHLRFGDYLAKSETYGGITTKEYYAAAVRYVREQVPGVTFFVFSNDETKAREWIESQEEPQNFTLITGNDEAHGDLDLYLMQLCDHFIIANSSFSWWGAYLGKKENKIVIAPSLWIHRTNGRDLSCEDIYTEDMIRISPKGEIVREKDRTVMGKGNGASPLVSVIVACYNVERDVKRAMDSLLSQTFPDFEAIAVDDGSTDGTGKILDDYAKKDPRVRVLHKENGGLSDARNAGLKVAKGAYIAYLDGDDFYDPDMLEYLTKAVRATGADIATVRYREASEEEKGPKAPEIGRVDAALRAAVLCSRKKALDNYVCEGLNGNEAPVIIYNSVWSKLFARHVIEDLVFPKGHNSEDILYTARALCRADSVVIGTKPFYNYVTDRTGSIMNEKAGERRMRDELPFWEEQIQLFKDEGYTEIAKKDEYYFYKRLLYYEMDFRKTKGCEPYAQRLEKWMLDRKDQILTCMESAPCATRGDVSRMKLFLSSPKAYEWFDALYGKTIVKVKQHGRG